jgi:hypothetical protein
MVSNVVESERVDESDSTSRLRQVDRWVIVGHCLKVVCVGNNRCRAAAVNMIFLVLL